MEQNEINNQIAIKQGELNLTHNLEHRKDLEIAIQILRHKQEIERIKNLIKMLQHK